MNRKSVSSLAEEVEGEIDADDAEQDPGDGRHVQAEHDDGRFAEERARRVRRHHVVQAEDPHAACKPQDRS